MQAASCSETPCAENTTPKRRALLVDLERRIALIGADLAEEEDRTKVYDIAQPTYSMLARDLRGRRDNLVTTIAILRRQFGAEQRAP
ncbi:hypothetical protein [Bradyrhizobium symbiodeficiens]|uniref:hypothetical protein n=1 Tax=Bradyrhizobium symbiodeficiens TaxID=1404367 RepID=UPI00140FBE0D|nr:hypothetical protein [Bradyrhizobium symbiodeficiens]QIO98830.1 hypothetical protein HAU86_02960 [Bradyrhizobium symbiodeficiens]